MTIKYANAYKNSGDLLTNWYAYLLLLAALTLAVSANAQTSKTGESPESRTAPRIEEVIVSATKRDMDVRELTSSVVALSGNDLETSGVQGQEDFLKLVPGVTFYNDNINSNRITIRGIGADLNTSNTTGVFIGDVPFEDPTLPRVTLDPNPFDLARVEVLKGPQGTLFGGSALNGAVRYIPQNPALYEWEAKVYYQTEDINYGGTGTSYGAAINIPVGEHLAFRVMGFRRDSDGWVDDTGRGLEDVNGLEQDGERFMALWEPLEKLSISAMLVNQDTAVEDSAITDNTEGRLSRSNTPQASPQRARYSLKTLGIQYSFDYFDVLSQTSITQKYFNAFIDASRLGNIEDSPHRISITNDNVSKSVGQELRFTSNSDSQWTWLAGAFYRKITLNEITDVLADGQGFPVPSDLVDTLDIFIPGLRGGVVTEDGRLNTVRGEADPIEVTELALFGEVTRSFWDSLEVTLGLRAFRNRSESRIIFSGALAFNQTLESGSTQTVQAGDLEETGVNPKLAVKYIVNPNISIYASASKGFRFGGAQVLIGTFTSEAPDTYKSDTIWAYELGLRTQWLDETLIVDVTPFKIDWTDPQLQQADSSGIGAYFDNVGGSEVKGVELAIQYLTPVPGLMLSFSGSYVDNLTTEPFIANNGEEIPPGTRWPLAAQKQTATTVSYGRNFWADWDIAASATYITISEAPNTLAFLDTVFGYQSLDFNINLGNEVLPGRPQISLTLNNARDERGIVSGVNNPQFLFDHVYIKPRTLTARLSLSF